MPASEGSSKRESSFEIRGGESAVRGEEVIVDESTYLAQAADNAYEALVDDDDVNEDVIWLREQRALNKSLHWLKRPSLAMICFVIFIYALSMITGESARQIVTYKLACNSLISGDRSQTCDPAGVQVLLSSLEQAYLLVMTISGVIVSSIFGKMSDRYGRKPFVVITTGLSLMGRVLKFCILSRSTYLHFKLLILAEIVTNACGGVAVFLSLCSCYIVDTVETHERIYALGLSLASAFIGMTVGPVIGGLLVAKDSIKNMNQANHYSDIYADEFKPIKCELVIATLLFLTATFVLPESRSEKARKKSRSESMSMEIVPMAETTWSQSILDKFKLFISPLSIFKIPPKSSDNRSLALLRKERISVVLLVSIICVLSTLSIAVGVITMLYGIYQFSWTQRELSLLLTIGGATRAVVLIILSPILIHKVFEGIFKFKIMKKELDMVDFGMIVSALICEGVGFFMAGASTTTPVFLSSSVLLALGSFALPSLNSAVIKFYPESKTGEVFGAISLLRNLSQLFTPTIFLSIYKYALTNYNMPQIIFYFFGFLFMVAVVLMLAVKRILNVSRDSEPRVITRSNSYASMAAGEVDPLASFQDEQPNPMSLSNDEQSKSRSSISELHRKNSFVYRDRNQSVPDV